jgi:beta-glucosidase/6-phospho-beta-glucosidase/beta-galactosidase
MIDCYGDRVKYWLTFNEQNIFHMPEAFVRLHERRENPARAV